MVQIPDLKIFTNCPQRMFLKKNNQSYWKIFSEKFFPRGKVLVAYPM
jgi:hypothetical protein